MAGTAVFRIVVSSDSIKNATATSHGRSRLLETDRGDGSGEVLAGLLKNMKFFYFFYLHLPSAAFSSLQQPSLVKVPRGGLEGFFAVPAARAAAAI
jgi:hypothetical protein